MNLVIKPILFDYEDTYYCDEKDCDAFGLYDWKKHVTEGTHLDGTHYRYEYDPDAIDWIACFKDKRDAEYFFMWKLGQVK